MKIKFSSILSLFVVLLLGGCGYTNRLVLPNNASTLAVPVFENRIEIKRTFTYASGLEMEITQKVIDELLFDGNLKVVDEKKADLVLKGTLVAYEQEPLRFNDLEGVEEYKLFVAVNLELKDRRTGELIWTEGSFTGEANYFLTGARAISEQDAATQAIKNLADRVVNRIVEDW